MKTNALLCISGFDPTCNAGIIVDSITCQNIGVKPIALISALTAQNSKGLSHVDIIPERCFKSQLKKLLEDYTPKVIKTGILPAKYQIDLIADYLQKNKALLVVDPVKSASAGGELVSDKTYSHLIKNLFPKSHLVTPNIPEAELISSMNIKDINDIIESAKKIKEMGPHAVCLKGGHLEDSPVDILYYKNKITKLEPESRSLHELRGTGCRFASAIASYLFMEDDIPNACKNAKTYMNNIFSP